MLTDIAHALRLLRRQWGFALGATALLALGIAFSTMLFAVVQGALLEPWPYAGADRIVTCRASYPTLDRTDTSLWSAPEVQDLRESGLFETVIAGDARNVNLTYAGRPERVRAAVLTPNAFAALGVSALHGRTLTDEDARPGAPAVAVVSFAFWRDRLGGDPAVVGRTLRVSGDAFEVVGVMPRGFVFWDRELWMPLRLDPASPRIAQTLYVQAWLHPSDDERRVQPGLDLLARRLQASHPEVTAYAGLSIAVTPLRRSVLRDLEPLLFILLAAAALLLVVSMANLASLVLARGASREGELAIRLAIGATGWRVARQLLAETLIVGVAGGAAGIAAARVLLPRLVAAIPYGYIPAEAHVDLDARVLLVAAAAAVVAGAVIGLVPALRASRASAGLALKRASTRGSSRVTGRWQTRFLTAQIGLSIVVLAVAIALTTGVGHLLTRDVGWRTDDVWTARVGLPSSQAARERGARTYQAILERVGRIPGVSAVALSSALPTDTLATTTASRDAAGASTGGTTIDADLVTVTPDFFRVLGIPIASGRAFGTEDGPGSAPVGIVSRQLAMRLWPGGDAIGSTLLVGAQLARVVGISGDVASSPTRPGARPTVFLPLAQRPPVVAAISVEAADPARLVSAIPEAIAAVDAALPVFGTDTLLHLRQTALGAERLAALLLAAFGLTTLVLSTVGIFAVVSQSVTERRQEIAIRVTLGATGGRLVAAELRRAGMILGLAVPAALVIAIVAERAIGAALAGLGGASMMSPTLAAGAVMTSTVVATAVPAWRAVRRATMSDRVTARSRGSAPLPW